MRLGTLSASTRQRLAVSKFPLTLAAVSEALRSECSLWAMLWKIGDALIQECGPPTKRGENTGSDQRLKLAAKEIKKYGYPEYSFPYLLKLRRTAANFTDNRRLSSVSWWVHEAAKTPDRLDAIIKQAERENTRVTVDYAKGFKTDQSDRRSERGAGAAYHANGNLNQAHDFITSAYNKINSHRCEFSETDRRSLLKRARATAEILGDLIDSLGTLR